MMLRVLLLALSGLALGCPREASDPPLTGARPCATDVECIRTDAGCGDVFSCVAGRCELTPSRVQPCD
ncbi:MAG: hypothetical protein AAGH15_27420 [Myxococcota bacterium]